VRQQAIVDNDDDLDFGIRRKDWEVVAAGLCEAGFEVSEYWPGSLLHVGCKETGSTVDVFLFDTSADGRHLTLLGRAFECWGLQMAIRLGPGEDQPVFVEGSFGSGRLPLPPCPENLLWDCYGPDWKKPRRWAGHTLYSVRGSYAYGVVLGVMLLLVAVPSLVLSADRRMRPGCL
jgi:hypothetical protein